MSAALPKAFHAALLSLEAFAELLAEERRKGHTTEQIEMAWFAQIHERLVAAQYWHAGLNGSNCNCS